MGMSPISPAAIFCRCWTKGSSQLSYFPGWKVFHWIIYSSSFCETA